MTRCTFIAQVKHLNADFEMIHEMSYGSWVRAANSISEIVLVGPWVKVGFLFFTFS
jgi:hypothetical protein